MDSLSKMIESFDKFIKHGGVASSKSMVRLLPNTRKKMYKPIRDTPDFRRVQTYQHPQNMKYYTQQHPIKIKNSPSPTDELSQYFGKINMNKRTPTKQVKFQKSPSPNVLSASDDLDDLMKMFGNVKIQPGKKQTKKTTRKTTRKTKSTKASRRKLPKMDVDVSDDDFLSGLLNKSMRISTKQSKKPIAQPTRRSTRNVKKPDRFVPESTTQRKSERIKQKQDKRSPMKLSPIVEEKTKKQRKNG